MTEQTLSELFKELRESAPGPTVEPNSQDWAEQSGATAYHLITRHADNWADTDLMMEEFAAARVKVAVLAERERCALVADEDASACGQNASAHHALNNHEMVRQWDNRADTCRLVAFKIRKGAP